MEDRIYLDHNATSPLRHEVLECIQATMPRLANPLSPHQSGRDTRKLLEDAREKIAQSINAECEHIIFTSGGTEANAMAVSGAEVLLWACDVHPSLYGSHAQHKINITSNGMLDLEHLEMLLGLYAHPPNDTSGGNSNVTVAISWANNETGVIHDWLNISHICASHGVRLHIDAVQALGKIPIDVRGMFALGVSSLALCAHKIGAPAGVGALICSLEMQADITSHRRRGVLSPGGMHEKGVRLGTHNTIGIIGFGAAIECLDDRHWHHVEQLLLWHRFCEKHVLQHFPHAAVVAPSSVRLANTSCFALPPKKSHVHLMRLDLKGIDVSAGAACSSGSIALSPVLREMHLDETLQHSVMRVSSGWNTQAQDLAHLATIITGISCIIDDAVEIDTLKTEHGSAHGSLEKPDPNHARQDDRPQINATLSP